MDILKDIGDSIGEFVKVAEKTKQQKYMVFAWICVYMDLSNDLPEAITLNLEDEEWVQKIDYEQFSFECRQCHEYGNFGRNCLQLNQTSSSSKRPKESDKEAEGFTHVRSK